MIVPARVAGRRGRRSGPVSPNVVWADGGTSPAQRVAAMGQRGATVWLTGLPAAGKSTLGAALEAQLLDEGHVAFRLDGDNLRHGLNGDLGFSAEDRSENVRRTAHVACLMGEAGVVVVVALVSPSAADRALARSLHAARGLAFLEVFLATPLEECERRDPKRLYVRGRRGELTGVTGLDAPYEIPEAPDLVIPATASVDEAAGAVLTALRAP